MSLGVQSKVTDAAGGVVSTSLIVGSFVQGLSEACQTLMPILGVIVGLLTAWHLIIQIRKKSK